MSLAPFVLVYNLTPKEFEPGHLKKIEAAICLAVVDVIPELEPISGEIGFAFPRDPSVDDDSLDIPVRIIVDDLRDNVDVRGNLARAIGERFKQASPKDGRQVQVRIMKAHQYDGEYTE